MAEYVEYDEWDAAAGLIEPVMVDVHVGWYTEKYVLDSPLQAGPVPEGSTIPTSGPSNWHVEPLPAPLPRYRRELRWRRAG